MTLAQLSLARGQCFVWCTGCTKNTTILFRFLFFFKTARVHRGVLRLCPQVSSVVWGVTRVTRVTPTRETRLVRNFFWEKKMSSSSSSLFVVCRSCGATVSCAKFCGSCANSLREENVDMLVNQTNASRQVCADALDRAQGDAGLALDLLREGVGRQQYNPSMVPSAPPPAYSPSNVSQPQIIIVQAPAQAPSQTVIVNQQQNQAVPKTHVGWTPENSTWTYKERVAGRLIFWLSILVLGVVGGICLGVGLATVNGGLTRAGIALVVVAGVTVFPVSLIIAICLPWCCNCQ